MSNVHLIKKMCIFARKNEVLSFHIILPISGQTCHVTGLGESDVLIEFFKIVQKTPFPAHGHTAAEVIF